MHCPAGCMQWQQSSGRASYNGVSGTGVNNVTDCLIVCMANPQCVAFDYDTNRTPPCWVHLNSADLVPPYNYTSATSTQYVVGMRTCQSNASGRLSS